MDCSTWIIVMHGYIARLGRCMRYVEERGGHGISGWLWTRLWSGTDVALRRLDEAFCWGHEVIVGRV